MLGEQGKRGVGATTANLEHKNGTLGWNLTTAGALLLATVPQARRCVDAPRRSLRARPMHIYNINIKLFLNKNLGGNSCPTTLRPHIFLG